MSRSSDSRPSREDPAAGDIVIYPWVCPYCISGTWESEGEEPIACTHCEGRGLTDDVSAVSIEQRQLAPRPPAVVQSPCSDCRYRPGDDQQREPFWCQEDMPRGINGVLSPAAWAGGMPLGYLLCARWWNDTIVQAAEQAEEKTVER